MKLGMNLSASTTILYSIIIWKCNRNKSGNWAWIVQPQRNVDLENTFKRSDEFGPCPSWCSLLGCLVPWWYSHGRGDLSFHEMSFAACCLLLSLAALRRRRLSSRRLRRNGRALSSAQMLTHLSSCSEMVITLFPFSEHTFMITPCHTIAILSGVFKLIVSWSPEAQRGS